MYGHCFAGDLAVTATTTKQIFRTVAQTSYDFATWTTQPYWQPREAKVTSCGEVGGARLEFMYGRIRTGRENVVTTVAPIIATLYGGAFIRILHEKVGGTVAISYTDRAGTVVSYNAEPIWCGVIEEITRADSGGTGVQTIMAQELTILLAYANIRNAWAISRYSSEEYAYRAQTGLTFNGNRSTSTYSVDGRQVYIFDQDKKDQVWTAAQIIDYMLATHMGGGTEPDWQDESPIQWQIQDHAASIGFRSGLDYDVKDVSWNGKTVLDVLRELVSVRRGLVWWLEIIYTLKAVIIHVDSAMTGTLTIPISDYTTVASSHIVNPDLNTVYLRGLTITEDSSRLYNVIDVVGGNVYTTCTLRYNDVSILGTPSQLITGWTAQEKTDWLDAEIIKPELQHVFQRFKINPDWDRSAIHEGEFTQELPNAYDFDPDGNNIGSRVYDGEFNPPVPIPLIEFENDLTTGKDLDADETTPRLKWMGFVKLDNTSQDNVSEWYDLTGQSDIEDNSGLSLGFVNGPVPAIELGTSRDDGFEVAEWLEDSQAALCFTVTIKEALPLRITLKNPGTYYAPGMPRVLRIDRPEAVVRRALKGTLVGMDENGAIRTLSEEVVVRDDTQILRDTAAAASLLYFQPLVNVTWALAQAGTDAIGGFTSVGDVMPGASVASIAISATETLDLTNQGCYVSSVAWSFDDPQILTTYDTSHVLPEVQ